MGWSLWTTDPHVAVGNPAGGPSTWTPYTCRGPPHWYTLLILAQRYIVITSAYAFNNFMSFSVYVGPTLKGLVQAQDSHPPIILNAFDPSFFPFIHLLFFKISISFLSKFVCMVTHFTFLTRKKEKVKLKRIGKVKYIYIYIYIYIYEMSGKIIYVEPYHENVGLVPK